jgi:pimeloyl-ACP methyl ester carboxylesterase
MRIVRHLAHADRPATSLVIMLPGALQQPEDFVKAGFFDAVRKRGFSIDLTLVDLAIEYIGDMTSGATLQRIDNQVIQPARLQRYDEIWLGGVSIGGLIAIAYADRFPGQVGGLCLLSPYPGNRILTREIEAAGSLDLWQAGPVNDDAERAMWRWLQVRRTHPRVHMGYGQQDRFAPGLQLIAAAPATHHVDTVAGGHDWPTWTMLWENFLEQSIAKPEA